MTTTVSNFSRIRFSFVLALFFILSATNAFTYDWIVTLPADSQYSQCEIVAYGSGGDQGIFIINRGETYTWHATYGAKNTSYIDGRCQTPNWGTYKTQIQGRTCTGTDYKTSRMGGISCPNNVRVKICQKETGVGAWSHGFCPN